MKLNTGGYGIPHQPTVPPMKLSKNDMERKFINEVITLATTYCLNCYVQTDNMYGTVNCKHDAISGLKKSDMEIGEKNTDMDSMESFEPEITDYINEMSEYLNEMRRYSEKNVKEK
jgi:hypothetical protein